MIHRGKNLVQGEQPRGKRGKAETEIARGESKAHDTTCFEPKFLRGGGGDD